MSVSVAIRNLRKDFGSFTAVDDVTFSVNKGEVLGFIGPNGAGKSTTMRMATGYIYPTSGSIEICGYDVVEQALDAKRHLGYLPEGGPLYHDMTPVDFLRFIGQVRGMDKTQFNSRLDYVVEKLHLSKVLYQSIDTLSKGFKRRVALAQAILHDPEVLILDEPTDGLDPNQKYEVQQLIMSMAQEKSVIISTHILEEVEAICSRAVIISQGKIVEEGTPDAIASHAPTHNAVFLRINNISVGDATEILCKIKDVVEVIAADDGGLLVLPRKGKSIIAEVSKVVQKHKWEVQELYARPGQLTEAFRAITKTEE